MRARVGGSGALPRCSRARPRRDRPAHHRLPRGQSTPHRLALPGRDPVRRRIPPVDRRGLLPIPGGGRLVSSGCARRLLRGRLHHVCGAADRPPRRRLGRPEPIARWGSFSPSRTTAPGPATQGVGPRSDRSKCSTGARRSRPTAAPSSWVSRRAISHPRSRKPGRGQTNGAATRRCSKVAHPVTPAPRSQTAGRTRTSGRHPHPRPPRSKSGRPWPKAGTGRSRKSRDHPPRR